MQTLKLDNKTARRLYLTADQAFKTMLEESFTREFFNLSIIDQTPTMADIFAIGGKTLSQIVLPGDTKRQAAFKVLEFGIAVLNEGVKVDHSNSKQTKYEPRFIYKPGFGLSYDVYGCWHASTDCGPAFCYLDYKTMLHGVEVMKEYYNDFNNS